MAGSLLDRMIGAALLRPATYEEVEADTTANGQAAIVVGLAALAEAIPPWMWGWSHGFFSTFADTVVSWLVWALVTWLVGTRLLHGTADMGELLRTLGFAHAPGVLMIVVIVPVLGWFPVHLIEIWMLVAGVVAVRQALDFSTGKAIVTVIVGWAVRWVLQMTGLFQF